MADEVLDDGLANNPMDPGLLELKEMRDQMFIVYTYSQQPTYNTKEDDLANYSFHTLKNGGKQFPFTQVYGAPNGYAELAASVWEDWHNMDGNIPTRLNFDDAEDIDLNESFRNYVSQELEEDEFFTPDQTIRVREKQSNTLNKMSRFGRPKCRIILPEVLHSPYVVREVSLIYGITLHENRAVDCLFSARLNETAREKFNERMKDVLRSSTYKTLHGVDMVTWCFSGNYRDPFHYKMLEYERWCSSIMVALFLEYILLVNHTNYKKMVKAERLITPLGCSARNNFVDCGVFVMRHMETYKGDRDCCGLSREGNEQINELIDLLRMYTVKILLADCTQVKKEFELKTQAFKTLLVQEKKRLEVHEFKTIKLRVKHMMNINNRFSLIQWVWVTGILSLVEFLLPLLVSVGSGSSVLSFAASVVTSVYHMNVKSAFLYGTIDEEVYVMQPPGFQDSEFPARVYKVEKAMYGLHQAPRAWYGTLSKYLLTNGFQRGTIDQTLFIIRHRGDFILVQVYVDGIIFGSSNLQLCRKFEALMHEKFQMSAMGDILKKFGYSDVRSANTPMDKENPWGKDGTRKDVDLYLYRSMIESLIYLTTSRTNIMFAVCTCARHQVTPKECHLHAVKRIFRYLKGHPKLGLWYPKEYHFDLVAYLDSDYGGATQDQKSTTRGCQFLGRRLISWQCKKQTIMATSTTEAEYVAAASGCGYILWIQNRARIAQSSALPTAADEPASPFEDDSQGEACPTVFGLEAKQDRANIIKTSTFPHDSPPRVTSLATDEGSMQHKLNELTDLYTRLQRQQTKMASKIAAQELEITSLKARIKLLEDKDGGGAEPSREDATIKGRSLETGEEAGIEKSTKSGSNDTEELVNVLTSLDAASILTSGGQVSVPLAAEVATVSVPTGSGLVPIASPIFTTASVATSYSRRKGKEKMRRDEQIVKDAEIARIHAEEELQIMVDGLDRSNEMIAKHLHEYKLVKYQDHHLKILKYKAQQSKPLSKKQQREFYMSVLKSHSGWKTKHFKGMTLDEIREKFIPVWKRIKDFVPIGTKEEEERFKRKGLRLEQESTKKVKTSEEVSKEDLKTMMHLVPVEEHFDREDLNQLWALVKETLNIRQASSNKEKELWVELKRLYEPDVED
nr:putative ribonuclease H-like domain-containing protein [Tanacetum cinerariifolium]